MAVGFPEFIGGSDVFGRDLKGRREGTRKSKTVTETMGIRNRYQ